MTVLLSIVLLAVLGGAMLGLQAGGPQRVDDPDDRPGFGGGQRVGAGVVAAPRRRGHPTGRGRSGAGHPPAGLRTRQGDTYLMQTRGDANESGETWTVPADSTLPKIRWVVPSIGTASQFCARTWCWCSGWWSSAGCSSPRCGSRPDDTAPR